MTSIADNLAAIALAGGEPTINRTQLKFLKNLCTSGRAPEIDLDVTTNLIAVNQEVDGIFAQFKSLSISASADGCNEVYEYVRYPGKWSSFVRNIARLREARPDVKILICVVLQALNALNIVELFDWADGQDISIYLGIGRGLDQYNDLRILPPAIREGVWRTI